MQKLLITAKLVIFCKFQIFFTISFFLHLLFVFSLNFLNFALTVSQCLSLMRRYTLSPNFIIYLKTLLRTYNMALWFECKVKYERMMDNGMMKKVNEPYLVDALTFTEAEARIIEELKPRISGDYSVASEKKTKISEVFFNETGDRWYLVKVNMITYDERSDKEKKTMQQMLVQAVDIEDALDKFKEGMKGTMSDMEIAAVSETLIMDVFPIDLSADK